GFMVKSLLANATRAGCRTGVLPSKANSDVTTAVSNTLKGQGINNTTTTITVNGKSVDVSTAVSGDQIQVTVSVAASNVTWLPGTHYLVGTLSATFILLHE